MDGDQPRPRPDIARAWFEAGTACLEQGRYREAEAHYLAALSGRPDDADALNNLATALWQQGRVGEAEAAYRRALELRPDDFAILTNLGNAQWAQGRSAEAAECYARALRLQPGAVETRMNLGVVLSDLGRLDEAETSLAQAVRLRPDSADAHNNLGMNLARQGRVDDALACYEQALRLRPDYPEAHRNRALLWLARGDFARGLPEYEWRLRCRGHDPSPSTRPRWWGEDLGGRTVLLHAEQGLGDTVQMLRYCPLVKERGARVVAAVPACLLRLAACCSGLDQVVALGGELPDHEVQAPLMSLPAIFGTTVESIPSAASYLSVEHRQIHQPASGLRVGIAWQGNPRHPSDRRRSFPLACFEPLTALAGITLVSLQQGAGTEQLDALRGRIAVEEPPGFARGDVFDTATVIGGLDLVIAPDTAVAHLAGALGRPAWVALGSPSDWRWLADREDTPWYPSMRLFRQSTPGSWREVFERIAAALREELAGRSARANLTAAGRA